MKKTFLAVSLCLSSVALTAQGKDFTQFVNPFIGTGGHGHTFPGATVPHGMIQASPDTRIDGWDACSGYYYADTLVNGFCQTHLSGTGCSDLGDFLILPFTGAIDLNAANDFGAVESYGGLGANQNRSYASPFRKETERATPGYYGVHLDRYDVEAEIAAAPRSAVYRFTFPEASEAGVLLDLDYSINNQHNTAMGVEATGPSSLVANKTTHGWTYDQRVFLAAETSRPFELEVLADTVGERPRKKALLRFPGGTSEGEEILLKLAISGVDTEGAAKNLRAELPGWDFEATRRQGRDLWNAWLGKVDLLPEKKVADPQTLSDLTTFYTALYHTAIAPYLFTDVDGRYLGFDKKVHQGDAQRPIYTVFSLWDTHRALHPLLSIIDPELNNLFGCSLLAKGREGGIMPKWELYGGYTCCMPGYHSVALLADIIAKGQNDFSAEEALKAGRRVSRFDTTGIAAPRAWRRGLSPISKQYKDSLGYIPYEVEVESVANGLEYAYDDWCIAQIARAAGDSAAVAEFERKGQNYRNYFDPSTRFMRAKGRNGKWKEPLNPYSSNHQGDEYCEGTAFQWNWFVPQDVPGLIELMGGRKNFSERLDSLFAEVSIIEGNAPPDIAGLIGQYAHGNEPSHHIIHLYNYAGRPDRVQELVSEVMRQQYHDAPDGLSGNEDCGQMSAWYVLNALGIYQVCPGKPVYSLGRPWFEEAEVSLPGGKTLKIVAENFAPENRYVSLVKFNGQVLAEPFISHDELMKGGVLQFVMAATPAAAPEVADWVNPFIGTTNYGTTNPGALVPNGLMSVTPFNVMGSALNRHDKDAGWWSAPYDAANLVITGFSHVNLSGVGCPELSSLLLMPTVGALDVDYRNYGSTYRCETATPGYYSVHLDNGVKAETTATKRVGLSRFTFPKDSLSHLLLNLGEGLTNETGATLRRRGPREFEGSKLLGTFCYNPDAVFRIYFALRVDRDPIDGGYWKHQRPMSGTEAEWDPDDGQYKLYRRYNGEMSGDDVGAFLTFDPASDARPVEVQIGVSFVSEENAWENLEAEASGRTFDEVRAQAREAWNEALGRIEVEGGTPQHRQVFYTALYHTLIHPNILQDVNGQYPSMEGGETLTVAEGDDRYTVFSLWDTYRNLHQLLALVYPEKQQAMLRSMTEMSGEWGWMPKWELYGRETFTMEGDPAIPVIVDSYRKGLRDFDINAAYAAMRRSATTPGASNPLRPDNDPYLQRAYIPVDPQNVRYPGDNSVSHALEYYVADNALSWLARERGDEALADSLQRRALGWKAYYSPESGTLRPINPDGTFYSPFNPRQGENFEQVVGFHEGSAWNYTFAVPHDIPGLIRANGGKGKFLEKLRRVFADGLYDPANEPDIAYPYLFTHVKGAEGESGPLVGRLLDHYFTTAPDGLPGNDDTGTMSAWAVWSMMGLYPDIPGVPEYAVIPPVFDRVTVHLDPSVHGRSTLTLPLDKPVHRISHADLLK